MKAARLKGLVIILLSSVMIVACSSTQTPSPSSTQPSPQTAPKKEPALYTGKSCITRMADAAVRWQPDALPFHLESVLNAESTGQDGKATVWRGLFASPSRGVYKVFTCSGSRLPDGPPVGITSSAEIAYAANVPSLMFQPFQLGTDSDKAFDLAQGKGGAKLMEKNPQQPILYSLDWDPKQKELLWVVMYGTSREDSKGVGVIDAGTGKFLRGGK